MERKKFVSVAVILIAIAAAGFGIFGNAHAQEVGVTLPSVPTGVSATVVPPSQVSVSWTASTESSGTIEDYYVYRNGTQIATTADTSMVDSGLEPGVYNYTVAAEDANGNFSAQSSPANVTVMEDTTPPTAPTNVTISGVTSTNSYYTETPLTISWTASTDNIGVAGYYVYRNGVNIVTSTAAFTGTSISDTVPPGAYTYTIVAYDAAQNFSNQSAPATIVISVDTNPPSAPTDVFPQQISSTGINITWASSTDVSGIAGYQVFRNYVQIATTTSPQYTDTGLSTGENYIYTVTAYDVPGNISSLSVPAEVTMQQTSGPTIPYGLYATPLGTSTIKLSWIPSMDALAILGYNIYRNGTQIATVTSSEYLDEGLATGTYMYNVSATDVGGAVSATSSPESATVSGINYTSVATTTPVTTSSVGAPSTPPSTTAPTTFTQFLYFGIRSSQVENLQSLLAGNGYLASADVTGFFGNLTLRAIEKLQCAQGVVCTGDPGWGTVGPRTRAVLNRLQELQSFQTELESLERQLQ